jgi:hypothetical protein
MAKRPHNSLQYSTIFSRTRAFCIAAFLICSLSVSLAGGQSKADPLPSWNEGLAKNAILSFVASTTTIGGPDYVRVEDRIATLTTMARYGWNNRSTLNLLSLWIE